MFIFISPRVYFYNFVQIKKEQIFSCVKNFFPPKIVICQFSVIPVQRFLSRLFQRYVDDEIVDADNDTNHGHNDVTNDNDDYDNNDDNDDNDNNNDGNDDNNDSPNDDSCAYSSHLSSGRTAKDVFPTSNFRYPAFCDLIPRHFPAN